MKQIQASLAPWQAVACFSPIAHLAFFGGVATGKTYTGCQYAIRHFLKHPEKTGFIGANSYDQLTQATLRELFYWLDFYEMDYVIDQIPPASWGVEVKKKFKSYKNILSVKHPQTGQIVHSFTRVLSDPDALRGIEFSWYWIDETRDTPQNTHEIIMSRMRETDYIRGLLTSTTNGEDWAHKRFCLGNDGKLFGALHVRTEESVKLGIITQQFYSSLRRSYSELFSAQELDALHVNVTGGRAYYASHNGNKRSIAPWGDEVPDHMRPLVVGCDFNFAPAPHIWMVGQVGPGKYQDQFHWFGELAENETSTREMTKLLHARYPGFFYEVFGDVSGGKGTTSNAGEHDYAQIGQELDNLGANFTIDYDQSNPRVRDRVENMNSLFKNSLGEVRMTYNPATCPNFDADCRVVGWKKSLMSGRGRLDDGGDNQRTHATDGGGYAMFKKFPPARRGTMLPAVKSPFLRNFNLRG
jgi:hypothetical protein